MISKDPLEFEDRKKYTERLESIQKKTGLKDCNNHMEKSTNKMLVIMF